jgi:putative ABC transport system substrate-binding protein
MKRRTVLQLAAALLAFAGWAMGQAPKRHRLGLLATTDEKSVGPFFLDAFLAGMSDLGYALGRDFDLEIRYARGDMRRLPVLADELLALKPDLLMGIEPAVVVLAKKTVSVPIVLVGSSDPVAAGLVKSLARPGTNVTGMAHLYNELVGKQIELLTELVPGMSRVAYLGDSSSPASTRDSYKRAVAAAASARRLAHLHAWAQDADGVRRAFEQFKTERVGGVVIGGSGTMVFLRREILTEAARLRLPAVYAQGELPRQGGLVSYGADLPASYRNDVPRFVDRILRGAKPADLPVQQTTKYQLVINLKAAREIGVKIPQSDQVIE